jgi:hypothetical protein
MKYIEKVVKSSLIHDEYPDVVSELTYFADEEFIKTLVENNALNPLMNVYTESSL